jgi:hypothetical protein
MLKINQNKKALKIKTGIVFIEHAKNHLTPQEQSTLIKSKKFLFVFKFFQSQKT